jgi:hypothetical protein
VQPVMQGYRLSCCECGLTHTFEFKALEVMGEDGHEFVSADLPTDRYRVEFRCRVNSRSTSQIRRHMKRKSHLSDGSFGGWTTDELLRAEERAREAWLALKSLQEDQ